MRALRRRTALVPRVLLWSLVSIAAVAGLAAWARPATRPAAALAAPTPPEVPAVAERAVSQWVRAIDDTATDPIANAPVNAATGAAVNCWAVVTRRQAADTWQVLVAVDVPARLAGTRGPATWFAAVAVTRSPAGTIVADGSPALVAAPPVGEQRREGASWRTAPADDPLARTVAGFASALLTGAGDVTRYTAPSVHLDAITPAPFTAVAVARVAVRERSRGDVEVHASLTATTPTGLTVPLAYELVIVMRDSRWEITDLRAVTSTATSSDAAITSTTAAEPPPTTTTAVLGD